MGKILSLQILLVFLLGLLIVSVIYKRKLPETKYKPVKKLKQEIQREKMSVVGIDFGNLNTVVAVARNRGIDVIVNEVSNRATP